MQPTLYNTRTKQLEAVKPLDDKTVRVYSCGPTVYDHAHIGNLASFIFADTLRRMLSITFANSSAVQHVMNLTDIDDKTIARSQRDYADESPELALQKLTRNFERLFMGDMRAVGNDIDSVQFVRATDSIPAMQTLIRTLHAQGIAYIADDGVYFDIAAHQKNRTYGQLTTINTDRTAAARINNDEYDKDSIHDFALWKVQKPGEPAWDFELDGHNLAGRPGWHIECSAMSVQALGQPFDIHTGGIDLQFPHHENEIAQSTAGDQPELYANFFCYNEHILVEGKKMSKSLGNFYTLVDVLEHGFKPLAFRLLVLQAHYRSQPNFSWESLTAAHNRLRNLQAMADMRFQLVDDPSAKPFAFKNLGQLFLQRLQDDLDTPQALAALNTARITSGLPKHEKQNFIEFLQLLDDALGLQLLQSADISAELKQLISKREQARQGQDWAQADALRDEITAQGIELRDTPYGVMWQRT